MTWAESFKIADVCFDVADETEDSKVEMFVSDCSSGLHSVGAGLGEFEDRLTKKMDGMGFDPTIILAIVQAIASLFANCPKPPTPNQLRRRPFHRARVAMAIRRAA